MAILRGMEEVNDGREPWAWRDSSGPMTLGQAHYEMRFMCGCGDPALVAQMIDDALQAFRRGDNDPPRVADCDALRARFPADDVFYLVVYLLSHWGLEDHGTCAPGWLTPRGLALRDAFKRYGANAIAGAMLDYSTGKVVDWPGHYDENGQHIPEN
jgi:hypothetical protein